MIGLQAVQGQGGWEYSGAGGAKPEAAGVHGGICHWQKRSQAQQLGSTCTTAPHTWCGTTIASTLHCHADASVAQRLSPAPSGAGRRQPAAAGCRRRRRCPAGVQSLCSPALWRAVFSRASATCCGV